MAKLSIVRAVILASALLALTSCKKDKSSATAADANGDVVRLLDAGAEPKAPLRYKIAEGTTTKSNMDFTVATLATSDDGAALAVVPGVRLHIVSGPAMVTDKGVKFDVPYREVPSIGLKIAFFTDPQGVYIELTEGYDKY